MNNFVLRSLQLIFVLGSAWTTQNYLQIPHPTNGDQLLPLRAASVSLTRDQSNWRAGAGESTDERWLRQTNLTVINLDGKSYVFACRHLGPICNQVGTGSIKGLSLQVWPSLVDGRSWAMAANSELGAILDFQGQEKRLHQLKSERLLLLISSYLLAIAVLFGARIDRRPTT